MSMCLLSVQESNLACTSLGQILSGLGVHHEFNDSWLGKIVLQFQRQRKAVAFEIEASYPVSVYTLIPRARCKILEAQPSANSNKQSYQSPKLAATHPTPT